MRDANCAAINFGADLIVTRSTCDYKKLPITVMTPAKFATAYIGDDS